MGSNITNLHDGKLFVDDLPDGNIGRFALFQVAMVPVRTKFALIGPVAPYRTAHFDLADQGNQAGFDGLGQFGQLLDGPAA